MFCKIITFLSTYSQRCWAPTWSKAPIFTACVQTPPDLLFSTRSWVNIQRPAFVHCSRGEKLICVIMMAWSHINIFHAFNWIHLSLLSPEWKQEETRVRGIGPEARANLQTVAKGRLLPRRSRNSCPYAFLELSQDSQRIKTIFSWPLCGVTSYRAKGINSRHAEHTSLQPLSGRLSTLQY